MEGEENQNFNNLNIKKMIVIEERKCFTINILSGSYVVCLNEDLSLESRK